MKTKASSSLLRCSSDFDFVVLLHVLVNDTKCETCPEGTSPNYERDKCDELPIVYLDTNWVIVVGSLSGIGMLLTVWTTLLFCYYRDTNLVLASTPKITYPLLLGIFLSFTLPFFSICDQTTFTCGFSRVGSGIIFCLCYSTLLTKTNHLLMTSTESRLPKIPAILTDARLHVLILCGITFVQIGLSIVGLYLNAPATNLIQKYKGVGAIRVCHIPTYDRVAAYSYNILLGFVCTVYTFRARKIPSCFDEARNISFVLYTTMAIWLSFLVINLVDINMENQIIAKSIDIFLFAVTILAGVFGPKVYAIMFRANVDKRKKSTVSFIQNYLTDESLRKYLFMYLLRRIFRAPSNI